MKTIALLPARCGSKGIPHKNIHLINEKPMISYSIKALKNSIVDEIYVSTDCSEVKSVAIDYGAKVIDRPPEISTDQSPTIDCVKHAISYLNLSQNDIMVLVQPTSPMITSSDITNGIDTFNLGSHDTIISVTENHDILWEQKDNCLIPIGHDPYNRKRRQDMNKTYYENGAYYIFKVINITQHNCLYGYGNVGWVEIPKSRSFQVDDYEDLKIIERLLQ